MYHSCRLLNYGSNTIPLDTKSPIPHLDAARIGTTSLIKANQVDLDQSCALFSVKNCYSIFVTIEWQWMTTDEVAEKRHRASQGRTFATFDVEVAK